MYLKDLTKNDLYLILQNEILTNYSVEEICEFLNLHKGTIKRWIENQEVPINYFNELNKVLNYKYKLLLIEKEQYRNLDQFFTPVEEAKRLIGKSLDFITENWDIDIHEYTLIEPSAGDGSFYFNFPKGINSISLDIQPQAKEIMQQDWFEFKPTSKQNILIENPPFGLCGQLALKFMNYAADFCDFICFVLPPLFSSNGKGTPRFRVDSRYSLYMEFKVEDTNFHYPNGEKLVVNSVFQSWSKLPSKLIKTLELSNKKVSELKYTL
ncbi:hypothetical protein [Mycoplasma hafezii]|uniref:hypothetical protein n=1 Tax=Mycoplasma hafezii TaxID=525886 RepID=UPI003CF4CED9